MDKDLCKIFEHENFSPVTATTKKNIKGFAYMMGVESVSSSSSDDGATAAATKSKITGPTPHDGTLCDAAYRKNLNSARAALQAGANPNCRESEAKGGSSPLWYAGINGQLELVELLHEYGADINDQAADGETALHAAASGGHVAVCKWLLEHGANKDLKTEDGEDAAEKAEMSGWDECAQFLKSWSGSGSSSAGGVASAAASASSASLPPSDWRYKAAAYCNLASRTSSPSPSPLSSPPPILHLSFSPSSPPFYPSPPLTLFVGAPWVMFENGTAVFFAPENKGTSASSLESQALDYLSKHATYPLQQNRYEFSLFVFKFGILIFFSKFSFF